MNASGSLGCAVGTSALSGSLYPAQAPLPPRWPLAVPEAKPFADAIDGRDGKSWRLPLEPLSATSLEAHTPEEHPEIDRLQVRVYAGCWLSRLPGHIMPRATKTYRLRGRAGAAAGLGGLSARAQCRGSVPTFEGAQCPTGRHGRHPNVHTMPPCNLCDYWLPVFPRRQRPAWCRTARQ